MNIQKIELYELSVPLRTPFKTALRRVDSIRDIIVAITTQDGKVGYGEAPPTAVITGETLSSIIEAIECWIAPQLIGRSVLAMEENQELIHRAILGNTSAKAAVDMALYDLWSQQIGLPLFQALGGFRTQIDTDLTISVNTVEEMVRDAEEAVQRGYRTLKIKLGLDRQEDLRRMREIRRVLGSDIRLRVDANQGWSPKEALRIIHDFVRYDLDIELIEQPVHYLDLLGMMELTKQSPIPIMADESVFNPKQALDVIERKAADIINIKLMKSGGIYKALQILSVAEIYEVPCMIGCMLESKVSVSAAAHLAAAKKSICYVDLDGPFLCKVDPIIGGPVFEEAKICMNDSAGIGIQSIDGLKRIGVGSRV